MSIKTFKPTTPSRRQMTVSGFDGIDKKAKPEASLVETLQKHAGRNSYGRITVRHRGGGNKRKYRINCHQSAVRPQPQREHRSDRVRGWRASLHPGSCRPEGWSQDHDRSRR